MVDLNKDIQYLKGIGPNRKLLFNRLGIYTINDLITYFPRGYEDRSLFKTISELVEGDAVCVKVETTSKVRSIRTRNKLMIYKLLVKDNTGVITCIWFNNKYVENIKAEHEYIMYGKVTRQGSELVITQPEYEELNANNKTGRIVPVYSLTEKMNQNILRKEISIALDEVIKDIEETMPEYILEQYDLADIKFALQNIHFPEKDESFFYARYRLVFEELLHLQLMLLLLKNGVKNREKGIVFKNVSTDEILNQLAFTLTNAQTRVLEEIFKDMESDKCMNRLLQGDVGSGKTIVAGISMFKAVKNGYQCVLMAPTAILAAQHYDTLKNIYVSIGVKCGLLIGSTPKKEKEKILEDLKNGNIDILIGTHAIIEDNVVFKNLGLVITDEQHRFGVRQRSKLSAKAQNVDILIMTATPIPRTLGLILYGDMDISVIDELPPGRKKIDTFAITKDKEERLNKFIVKNVQEGKQVYIVCALIEESESIIAKSLNERYEYYSSVLNGCRIAVLHGRMKNTEKTAVMNDFKNGDIDVLISTTVIEVGVDVPNATLMVIENAERFGLAQLHQLRGRVGRGSDKSYCILKYDSSSILVKQRMNVMEKTNNGFEISEKDLELRGPGDFFGVNQHGLPDFKIANLFTDMNVLKIVQEIAFKILSKDKNLEAEENALLKKAIYMKYKGKLEL